MEASRLERVRIDVAGDIVEIAWDERDVLLEELAFAEGDEADPRQVRGSRSAPARRTRRRRPIAPAEGA
jgi:hypothetical protein